MTSLHSVEKDYSTSVYVHGGCMVCVFISVCIHVCNLGCGSAMTLEWRAEGNLGCLFLASILFETRSFTGPWASRESCCLCLPSQCRSEGITNVVTHTHYLSQRYMGSGLLNADSCACMTSASLPQPSAQPLNLDFWLKAFLHTPQVQALGTWASASIVHSFGYCCPIL